MRCQSCGREIADKAIVCYRCGAPTAIPERHGAAATPPGSRNRSPVVLLLVAVVLMAVAGLVSWQDGPRWASLTAAAVALVALVGVVIARRSGPRA